MYSGNFFYIICRLFHGAIFNKQHAVIYNLNGYSGTTAGSGPLDSPRHGWSQSPWSLCSLNEIFYYNLARNMPKWLLRWLFISGFRFIYRSTQPFIPPTQSNMSMHHYECVALCFVNILQ